MFIRNWLGSLSLLLVAVLFLGLEALLKSGVTASPWVRILASGFEAGTVGALADWFAVTALFSEVPIPFLRRHTNILLRKRDLLTGHIVDVVQNQWLTPRAIADYLAQRSPSAALLTYLSDERHQAQLLEVFREFLVALTDRLDGPEMMRFLAQVLKRQIDRSDLERLLGERLEEAIRKGDHGPAVDAVLGMVESAVREGTLRDLVRGWILEAARAYGARGTMKAATTWMLEKSGGLDYDRAAEDIVGAVARSIRGVRGQADHPMRVRIDEAGARVARGLAEGNEEYRKYVLRLRTGLLAGLESESGLREILRRAKESIRLQLGQPASAILLSVAFFLRARMEDLRSDPGLRERLDGWVLQTTRTAIERNPSMIGEMIRDSLAKLEGPQLVAQIQQKVGPELQYIRLNGAIIGTLVGLALGSLHWLMG